MAVRSMIISDGTMTSDVALWFGVFPLPVYYESIIPDAPEILIHIHGHKK